MLIMCKVVRTKKSGSLTNLKTVVASESTVTRINTKETKALGVMLQIYSQNTI